MPTVNKGGSEDGGEEIGGLAGLWGGGGREARQPEYLLHPLSTLTCQFFLPIKLIYSMQLLKW